MSSEPSRAAKARGTIFEYSRGNRFRVLWIAAALLAGIASLDLTVAHSAAMGFLYIVPLVLAAGFLERWQTVLLSVGAAVLREAGSSRPWSDDYLGRIALVTVAFAAAALFVKELSRNQQMALERIGELKLRRQLEQQLRHAQRLEAVGRLAGGIAHDFNNLLSVIIGFGDLALGQMQPSTPARRDVEEMHKAAGRAADVTRQLLEFSRRDLLQPATVDLNLVVSNLSNMLRRLIGEDIDLHLALQPRLPPVKADAGGLEQVVMNLVFNARDAMPQGGRLTLQTAQIEIESPSLGMPPGIVPGNYVTLAVRDTGPGMERSVQEHLFEPFFTTKEAGKGTGLGLATVYGIVKQTGGYVWFRTGSGQGTTFTIYLPPTVEAAEVTPVQPRLAAVRRSPATVLLVEDDAAVRKLAREILIRNGLTVIEAAGPGEAIALSRRPAFRFDLLLSDVIMPEMSGPELAGKLAKNWPRLNVLFMTGYADPSVLPRGLPRAGMALIRKPLGEEALMRAVRAALSAGAEPHQSCA